MAQPLTPTNSKPTSDSSSDPLLQATFKPPGGFVRRFFAFFGFIYGVSLFLALLLIFTPIALVLLAVGGKKRGPQGAFLMIKVWGHLFSWLTGTRYQITGLENLPNLSKEPVIFVTNHGSYLDAISVGAHLPGEYRPLGKIEFVKIPLFGMLYSRTVICVDRKNAESRKQSVDVLRAKLKEGYSILIFPEGTMNKTKASLQPFKEGAFRLSLETGLPILPFAMVGARELMPRSVPFYLVLGGKIRMTFGKPIFPSAEARASGNTTELKEKTRASLEALSR